MMFFPRDLEGTDSGDGDIDEKTDNDEDGKSDANNLELEVANLDRLTDAISLVVSDGSAVADAAGDDTAATTEAAAAEESSKAENAEYFGEDELTLASDASNFSK